MQEKYGADGFKFDAGDIGHYNDPELEFYDKSATSVDMCRYWAKIGLISRLTNIVPDGRWEVKRWFSV